ncbi:MAG: hypothetical protein JOZ41_17230, partial [Chloroflexi bacterium]|nr:hypothetical protein [Chloroflexota bacterium]
TRNHPILVICSRLTETIEAGALAWILLYPEGERRVILGSKGRRVESLDLDLDELLAFLDRAARTAQPGGEAVPTNGHP